MVSGRGVGAVFARARAPIVAVLLVIGGAFLLCRDQRSPKSQGSSRLTPTEIRAAFGRLPMSFEQNQGQAESKVKFLARGNGYGLYLAPTEAALVLGGGEASAVEMKFAGSNPNAEISGSQSLPGRSNYLIGNDPSRWHRNIPQFGRVVYREVYPGVDLAFYGNQGRLEYDFDVAPGADPNQIQLDLSGADALHIAPNGDLVLTKDARELRFQAPRVYQTSSISGTSAGTQTVSGSFVLVGNNRVSFKLGNYDRSRSLVIDPVLVFSSYLGGSLAESCGVIVNGSQTTPVAHCPAIAVDGTQRVYVAGSTLSTNFPAPTGGPTPVLNGPGADIFLARFNPSGTALEFTAYLGGSGTEYPAGAAVDAGLNVYVAGTTDSTDFPVTSTAFQASPTTGGNHVFVTKVDSTLSGVLYSTYLAGQNGNEVASGMALDSLNRVYVMGITSSTNTPSTASFPATLGALQTCPGETTSGTCPTPPASQFFFSKVDPSQSGSASLAYSTYIGGSTPSNAAVMGGAVAVDSSFNVYLTAGTGFTDMPVVNPFQSGAGGKIDVWVGKLMAPANNTQQYTLNYETYLGAGGDEIPYGIATDGTKAYVTGRANAGGITTVPKSASGTLFPADFVGGAGDAFVAKFGVPVTTGTTQGNVPLEYFTYVGGTGDEAGLAIAADSNQNAYVAGWTNSGGSFPQTTPLTSGGGTDAFFARIWTTSTSTGAPSGSGTSTVSILGGTGTDIGTSLALDTALNSYIAGDTNSTSGFPNPSSLPFGGGTDTFVTKLGPSIGLTFTCSGTNCPATNPTVSPNPSVGVGSQVTFTYTIYNPGDPVTGVVFTDNFGPNATFVSASPGTCGTPSGGIVVCTLGAVPTSASNTAATTVTIKVTAPSTAPGGAQITNSATLSVLGTGFQVSSIPQNAIVSDFSVSIVQPSSATVIAGGVATYQALVMPTPPGFPGSVSLSCASNLPPGVACSFVNNPIPNMLNGPQSRTFEITTTARVTTPGSLFQRGPTYALWMPIVGVGLMGAGISRKRRILLGAFIVVVLGVALLQAGCGSSNNNSSTTTGTPTGTYTIVINATGGATRSTSVQLTVE